MKLPPDAPKLGTGSTVTAAVTRPDVNGQYLSWDELRRRTPPAGITHEQWWASLRGARMVRSTPFPLTDVRGAPFRFALTDPLFRLIHEIDRVGSGRIELPEEVVNPSTRDRYLVDSVTEEAITSSQLEGASTTRVAARSMLRSGRKPMTVSERMIVNNYRAMEFIRNHRAAPLTRELVAELHTIVVNGTLKKGDGEGRFRRPDETIHVVDSADGEVLHVPPPADQLPARIEALCRFANTDSEEVFIHPLVRAVAIHFWLAYDHPFVDGNGRTARALFYWAMLRHGYWLTEFLSISRVIKKAPAQYSRAFLYTETYDNDLTYFLLHQLLVLRQAHADLNAYLARKGKEVREVERLLRNREDLNHRQIAVLAHALRHPDERYTIQAHQRSHGVVYQTARQDLLSLSTKGFFVQRRIGNAFVFDPVTDLERRLKGRSRG